MGPQEDYIETVFTCEGDFNDPHLQDRLEDFQQGLKDLLLTDKRKLILKKVEPWNSVRVTFNIPREAALRLKQLAQQGNTTLRSLGVLAVQIQGDQLISLTIAGRNNERTELIFQTTDEPSHTPAISVFDSSSHITDELHSPGGPNNVETTRKNIAEYLRQGTLFDSLFAQESSGINTFKSPNVVATSCKPIPFRPNNVIQSCTGFPQHISNVQGPTTGFHCSTGYITSPSETVKSSNASRSPVSQPNLTVSSSPGIPAGMPPGFPPGILSSQPLQRNDTPFPPFPQGNNMINNLQKAFKAATSTSPLLVNLLQTDPNAAINTFLGAKMPPPPEESPPPSKRKRKPRKPKDSKTSSKPLAPTSDGEISIQSVPNPALSSHGVPLATSGSISQISNRDLLPHSLPVVRPNVTHTSQDHQISLTITDSLHLSTNSHLQHGQELLMDSVNNSSVDITSQDTAGKIVNPYTGLLEPVENLSDSSPSKGDNFKEQLSFSSPVKLNESKLLNRTESAHQVENKRKSSPILRRAVPPSSNSYSSHENILISRTPHVYSTASGNVVSSNPSCVSLQQNPSHLALVKNSSHVFASQPNIAMHSSHLPNSSYSVNSSVPNQPSALRSTYSSTSVPNAIQEQECLSLKVKSEMQIAAHPFTCYSGKIAFESREPLISVATSDIICRTSVSGKNSHPISQTGKSAKALQSNELSNKSLPKKIQDLESIPEKGIFNIAHTFISKTANVDSQVVGSPNCKVTSDGDSENSSQGSVSHDVQLPNDIISLQNEPSLDSGLKPYNHDSGVGSSSERSDDTPSEPGDADFKPGHTLPEDCGKPHLSCDNLSRKQAKTDTNVITVGYALSQVDSVYHHAEPISGFDPNKDHLNLKVNSENFKKHSNAVSEASHLLSNLANWSVKKKAASMYADVSSKENRTKITTTSAVPGMDAGVTKTNVDLLHNIFPHSEVTGSVICASNSGTYQEGVDQKTVNCLTTRPVLQGENTVVPLVTTPLQRCSGKSIDLHVSTSSSASQCSRSNPASDLSLGGPQGPDYSISPRTSQRIQDAMLQTVSKLPPYSLKHDLSMHKPMKYLDDSALVSTVHSDSLGISKYSLTDTSSTNLSSKEEKNMDDKPRNPYTSHHSRSLSEIHLTRLTNHTSGKINAFDKQSQCAQLAHRLSSCNKETPGTSPCSVSGSVSIQSSATNVTSLHSIAIPSVSYSQNISSGGNNVMMNSTVMECANSTNCGANIKHAAVSKSCTNISNNQDPSKNNITSIYTRRSSPVNSSVNSLHCYDPALPLPKRLTESIQKLVKPLMTLDSSTSNQRKSPISSIPKSGTPTASSKGNSRFGNGFAARHCGTTVSGSISPFELSLPVSSPILGLGCKMVGFDSSNCEDILPGIGLSPLSSMSGEICVNEPACSSSVVLSSSSQSTITAPVIIPTTLHANYVSNAYSFAANSLQSSHCDMTNVSTPTVLQPSQPALIQRTVSKPANHSTESLSCKTFSEKLCMLKESEIKTSSNVISPTHTCSITETNFDSQNEVPEQEQSETNMDDVTTQESTVIKNITPCVNFSGAPSHCLLDSAVDIANISKSQNNEHETKYSCDQNRGKRMSNDLSCSEDLSGNECKCLNAEQNSLAGITNEAVSFEKVMYNVDSTLCKNEFVANHNTFTDSVLVAKMNTDDSNDDHALDKMSTNYDSNVFNMMVSESRGNRVKLARVDMQRSKSVNCSEFENDPPLSVSLAKSLQHAEIDLNVKAHRTRRTSESSEGSHQSSENTRALHACRKRVRSAEQNTDDDPENDKSLWSCWRKKTALNNLENNGELYDKIVKVDTENKNDLLTVTDSKSIVIVQCLKEDHDFTKTANKIGDISGSTENQTLIDTVKSGLRVRASIRNAHIEDLGKTNSSTTKDWKKDSQTPVNKLVLEKNVKVMEEDAVSRRGQIHLRNCQIDKSASYYPREKSPFRGTRRGRNSPNVEQQEDMQKRSTRSSKQKDISEIPPSKRRKSSRDHR